MISSGGDCLRDLFDYKDGAIVFFPPDERTRKKRPFNSALYVFLFYCAHID